MKIFYRKYRWNFFMIKNDRNKNREKIDTKNVNIRTFGSDKFWTKALLFILISGDNLPQVFVFKGNLNETIKKNLDNKTS